MSQVKNASSATSLANSFANVVKNGTKADDVGNYVHQKSAAGGPGQENSDSGSSSGGFGSGSGMGGSGTGMGGGGGRGGR